MSQQAIESSNESERYPWRDISRMRNRISGIRFDDRQNRYSRLFDLIMLGTALLYIFLQA